jgi:uncharacterized protein YceK
MRLPAHFLCLGALAFCTGCGSMLAHIYPSQNPVYIGTRGECQAIVHKDSNEPIWVPIGICVDLPFTFVADTLFFPFDLNDWIETSRPDPLKGWTYHPFPENRRFGSVTNTLDKAIVDDYQGYIAKKGLSAAVVSGFYEDGQGHRAVEFEASASGNESWHFAIIYNKQNKRVKVVRFGRERYMC